MKRLSFLVYILVVFFPCLYGQKIRILTNHIGYENTGAKFAVVEAFPGDDVVACFLKLYDTDELVMSIKPVKAGKVAHWKSWVFWTLDFSAIRNEGKYYIECKTSKGIVRSFPFLIQENLLERHTISDVVAYFKAQRCVGQMEKADGKMTFYGGKGDTVDVHGGWQDATGDYGKHLSHLNFTNYFVPQQIPLVVYSLCKTYELLDMRKDENFRQVKRRIVDEILYGADYLVRIKVPGGSFYRSISAPGPGKRPEDRRIAPIMRKFRITKSKDKAETYDVASKEGIDIKLFEASYRGGGGIAIASLAMASRLSVYGDFPSSVYLETAENAFEYLEKHNLEIVYDGKNNIIDDYCALSAAVELFKATGKNVYKKAADRRASGLMRRLSSWGDYINYWRADDGDRPFFHPSDEGFPIVSLIYYMEICDSSIKKKVLEVIRKSLEFYLSITSEVNNPFGYARQLVQHKDGSRNSSFFFPHDTEAEPWWQGENARIASLACAARMAVPHFRSDSVFVQRLEKFADNQLHWILGLNPFDVCMLDGSGRNNPEYIFFGSYQYMNIPGGICNGITAGLENEEDIDFNIPFSVTGKDYDWRWTEQWLPHAAWFLMAVSARGYKF